MKITVLTPPHQTEMVDNIAKAYQQTFAGYPWFEGLKCQKCTQGFPLTHTETICPNCSTPEEPVTLVDYWPTDTIVSCFEKEMAEPQAVCIVVQKGGVIVAFSWGYRVSSCPELDEKLAAPELHRILAGEYFYLDEVAVIPLYQKIGIGTELVISMLAEQPFERVLLRTKEEGPMFKLIIKMGGEIIQHISGDRVIMKISKKK